KPYPDYKAWAAERPMNSGYGFVGWRQAQDLSRQRGSSHEELIDRTRALTAFADGPHHQRLAAAHVAGGEQLGAAGLIAAGTICGRSGIAALIFLHAEGIQYFLRRADEAHGKQD